MGGDGVRRAYVPMQKDSEKASQGPQTVTFGVPLADLPFAFIPICHAAHFLQSVHVQLARVPSIKECMLASSGGGALPLPGITWTSPSLPVSNIPSVRVSSIRLQSPIPLLTPSEFHPKPRLSLKINF